MKATLVLNAVLLVAISGCTSFSVYEEGEKIKGVPFYRKVGVTKQTTEITRTWIVAKLSYERLDSNGKSIGTPQSADFYINPNTYKKVHLEDAFADANTVADKGLAVAVSAFRAKLKGNNVDLIEPSVIEKESASSHCEDPTHLLQSVVSNTVVKEATVDYGTLFYFNSNVPLFGTSAANIELASDGTLAKASATVDMTKPAELIPLKELILDAVGVATVAPVIGGVKLPSFRLALDISVDGYRYELSEYCEGVTTRRRKPLTFQNAVSISRKPLNASTKESNKNSIKFSGSVSLPKEKK